MSTYIAHHGIKGQKWGVRRYQNPDGSLTDAGKKRYLRISSKAKSARKDLDDRLDSIINNQKKQVGIISIDKNTDVVLKGSTFKRIASEGEPIDARRKYVSIIPDDSQMYLSEAEFLPTNYESAVQFSYKAKKDLKIATADNVRYELNKLIGSDKVIRYKDSLSIAVGKDKVDDALKMYGDTKISELIYDPKTSKELKYNSHKAFTDDERLKNDWLIDYLRIGEFVTNRAYDQILLGNSQSEEIYEFFKNKGYDAIVDINDIGTYTYPLILLNPVDSIEKIGSKKLYEV